jgi:E3 ubiquitin-protein ligase RNF14
MADKDAEETEDERLDELNTLQSIYPELAIDLSNPAVPTASIELAVTPTNPLPVVFEPKTAIHKLSHLPPLLLEIIIHEDYPAKRAPTFRLTTSPQWLPTKVLKGLEDEGHTLWADYGGMPMLFAYISFLEERAQMAFQDSESSSAGPVELPDSMKTVMIDLDDRLELEAFHKESYVCGVCLDPKKGSQCYRLRNCRHVFCIECLQDYFNSCIEEGNTHQITCLDPDCGKTGDPQHDRMIKPRLISPKELLRIPLTLDTVTRYVRIKRKKKLESDRELVWCPRTWCQGVERTEKYPKPGDISQMDDEDLNDDDDGDENENDTSTNPPPVLTEEEEYKLLLARGAAGAEGRVAVCEDCHFAFCRVCSRAWHGDHVRCVHRDQAEISKEERMSMDYIQANAKPCPTCNAPVQKTHGCNKMRCLNCKSHFCYLCGNWLPVDMAYKHFNDRRSGCYGKLFEGLLGEEEGEAGAAEVANFHLNEAFRIQMELNQAEAAAFAED